MRPEVAAVCFLLAIAALVGVVVLFVIRSDRRYQREMPTTRMRPVRHHPVRMLPPEWPCAAPRLPFTPDRAHVEMQLHIDCLVHECPRKMAAYRTLVTAGHIVPSR